MVTIYAVSAGDYSDYRVKALYSTREMAQKHAAIIDDANDIEEYELDNPMAISSLARGERGWLVWGWRGSVEVTSVYPWDTFENAPITEHPNGRMSAHILARDKDHAIKVAADLFRAHKALQP